MNCNQWQLLIQKDIDDCLPADQAAQLHMHLNDCDQCAAFARDLQKFDLFLKQELAPVDPPADFTAQVMAALPAQQVIRPQTVARSFGWRRFALVAAALLLVAGITTTQLWDYTPQSDVDDPVVAANDPASDNSSVPVIESEPDTDAATTVNPADQSPTDTSKPPNEQAGNATNNNNDNVSIQQDDTSYSGNLDLPTVAYSSQSQGEYSLTMLASYDGYDSILPSFVSSKLIEYYVYVDGTYQKWQQTTTAKAAPVFISDVESVPTLITGSIDSSWLFDYNCFTATSPDNSLRATNRGGDQSGFYVYSNIDDKQIFYDQDGGGSICFWSADSNKILYTTASGELKVYYAAEKISITVYDSVVSSACWSADSNSIVFAATAEGGLNSNIYRVILP